MQVRRAWQLVSSIALAAAVAGGGCTGPRHGQTTPVATEARPAPLTRDKLALRRAVAIQRIHDYAEAGVFPTDDAGMPIGVFRDDHGRRCPMSQLIYQSGRDDLVDAVVRTNNRLKLADVHSGPLMDWMLQSGLTQEEIVMVQGAMDLQQTFRAVETPNGIQLVQGYEIGQASPTAIAFQEVKNRLAIDEVTLRDNTARSLDTATARLKRSVDRRVASAR